MEKSVKDFYKIKAERRRQERAAIKSLVQGATHGDFELFWSGIVLVEERCAWRRAFRALAGLSVPIDLRTRFAREWLRNGDHIRGEVNDDLVLIAGLRTLLPQYVGGPIQLYRGDSAYNRRHRTYGISWTANLEVARGFANGIWRTFEGGSLVVTTLAPPEAVISVPGEEEDRYAEEEYLVDRRLLKVDVAERFSQLTPEQYRAHQKEPSTD